MRVVLRHSRPIENDQVRSTTATAGFNHWVTGAGRTWVLLVTAAILPLLLFGGLAASFSAEHTRAATRALASGTAEQVGGADLGRARGPDYARSGFGSVHRAR